MANTKITLRVENRLLQAFNKKLESCFMKRDAFLHHAIKTEIQHLEEDLKGVSSSKEAKQYITAQLRDLTCTPINVVVPQSTANRLRRVLKSHNVVRDSFINRLILFLLCPLELGAILDLPDVVENSIEVRSANQTQFVDIERDPVSPFGKIDAAIRDPLGYIREYLEIQNAEPIYRVAIHPKLDGFNCYLPDERVPGTAENAKLERESRQFWKKFLE